MGVFCYLYAHNALKFDICFKFASMEQSRFEAPVSNFEALIINKLC
jgi:hypothetical protein